MAARHWLDQFAIELHRQRLPAGYSARLLEELADHLSQLEQESTSMDAQLLLEERIGKPEVVAAEARSEFTRRTFAGRHPVLTFGVIPVFVVVGTLIASLLVAWGVAWLACMTTPQLREQTIPPNSLQLGLMHAVVWFVRLTPFVLVAWAFAREGRRIQRPKLVLLSTAIIAVLAFGFWMTVRPPTQEVQGLVVFGLAIQQIPRAEQWLQAAFPLAIGLWTWWSMQRLDRQVGAA